MTIEATSTHATAGKHLTILGEEAREILRSANRLVLGSDWREVAFAPRDTCQAGCKVHVRKNERDQTEFCIIHMGSYGCPKGRTEGWQVPVVVTDRTRFGVPDPRVMGGTYLSAYWRKAYRVILATQHLMVCKWEDGRVTHHCTPWDAKRDSVLVHPGF